MQHRYFGKYASYYLFSVAYHKIPLAQLTLLASRINAPQQTPTTPFLSCHAFTISLLIEVEAGSLNDGDGSFDDDDY